MTARWNGGDPLIKNHEDINTMWEGSEHVCVRRLTFLSIWISTWRPSHQIQMYCDRIRVSLAQAERFGWIGDTLEFLG